MNLSAQFRLVLIHGVLFGLLTMLGFLGALSVYVQFAPAPLAAALSDLNYFAPVMGLGALVLGSLQAIVVLWLYAKNLAVFWLVQIVLAILFGGLAAFFSIWLIWTTITLLNLFLVWVLCLLIARQLAKTAYHDLSA